MDFRKIISLSKMTSFCYIYIYNSPVTLTGGRIGKTSPLLTQLVFPSQVSTKKFSYHFNSFQRKMEGAKALPPVSISSITYPMKFGWLKRKAAATWLYLPLLLLILINLIPRSRRQHSSFLFVVSKFHTYLSSRGSSIGCELRLLKRRSLV